MISIKDYPKHKFAASEDTFVLSLPSRVNESNIGSSHGILGTLLLEGVLLDQLLYNKANPIFQRLMHS